MDLSNWLGKWERQQRFTMHFKGIKRKQVMKGEFCIG
jgi:hypothetical protein